MLYGISVYVVYARLQVSFVADEMFPEAALPDAAFAVAAALGGIIRPRYGFREVQLYEAPACREIGVAFWQAPDAMEMVWQDADGDCLERPCFAYGLVGRSQFFDFICEKTGLAVGEIDREEVSAAGHVETAIIRHDGSPNAAL